MSFDSKKQPSIALSSVQLPPANSPDVILDEATATEKYDTWLLNYAAWGEKRPLSFYLAKEDHLTRQPLTEAGGITHWVLVDSKSPPAGVFGPRGRQVLSSCDTIRKQGFIASDVVNGQPGVKEVVTHCLYSVFTRPEYRHRGYATKMMKELKQKLQTWGQRDGDETSFAAVYSDIGKDFYARHGWEPSPSFHLSLPSQTREFEKIDQTQETCHPRVSYVYASGLPKLCLRDEELVREEMQQNECTARPYWSIALAPDCLTMQWHHAGEDITALEMVGRYPEVKGALAKMPSSSVWCIWTRTFDSDETDRVLNILRLVIDAGNQKAEDSEIEAGVRAVLREAQREASDWDLHHVDIWNPSIIVQKAALKLTPAAKVEQREDSIACLMRFGSLKSAEKVQWVANEKFGNWF